MFAPGGIALAMSVIVGLFMKESPEKLGYPAVGESKPKPKSAQAPGAPLPTPSWEAKRIAMIEHADGMHCLFVHE